MPRRPVNPPYTITTEFGVVDSYAKFGRHSGVDYAVPRGRAIYAPASGVLTNVESPTGGKMVVIFDGQFWHRLMHNLSYVRQNGSVQEGDQVATADSTGLSTGDHCHWDINAEGIYPTSFAAFRDPWRWLQGEYVPPKPTPPPLAANQRRLTNPTGVNQRAAPTTSAAIIKEWPLDSDPVFNFKGFVRGESVNGNNIWFVGATSGGYFSSVAFEGGPNTAGLPDLTPTPSEPTPPVPTDPRPPVDEFPAFTKDLACVTEVIPAYKDNYQVGNFPVKPTGVVLHDFGTDGVNTYQATINYFRKPGIEISAHFVVSGKKITQMVSLSNRAWHAGPNGNMHVGIEIDPDVDSNIDTKNSVVTLLRQLDEKYGVLTRYLHSQFMATACGDDIQKANLLIPPQAPTNPSDVQDQLDDINSRLGSLERIVKAIKDFIESIFNRKIG